MPSPGDTVHVSTRYWVPDFHQWRTTMREAEVIGPAAGGKLHLSVFWEPGDVEEDPACFLSASQGFDAHEWHPVHDTGSIEACDRP